MVKVETHGPGGATEHGNAAAFELHASGALLLLARVPGASDPMPEYVATYAATEWKKAEVVGS